MSNKDRRRSHSFRTSPFKDAKYVRISNTSSGNQGLNLMPSTLGLMPLSSIDEPIDDPEATTAYQLSNKDSLYTDSVSHGNVGCIPKTGSMINGKVYLFHTDYYRWSYNEGQSLRIDLETLQGERLPFYNGTEWIPIATTGSGIRLWRDSIIAGYNDSDYTYPLVCDDYPSLGSPVKVDIGDISKAESNDFIAVADEDNFYLLSTNSTMTIGYFRLFKISSTGEVLSSVDTEISNVNGLIDTRMVYSKKSGLIGLYNRSIQCVYTYDSSLNLIAGYPITGSTVGIRLGSIVGAATIYNDIMTFDMLFTTSFNPNELHRINVNLSTGDITYKYQNSDYYDSYSYMKMYGNEGYMGESFRNSYPYDWVASKLGYDSTEYIARLVTYEDEGVEILSEDGTNDGFLISKNLTDDRMLEPLFGFGNAYSYYPVLILKLQSNIE